MYNRLIPLFILGAVLVAFFVLWLIGRDERIIRNRLFELAEVVSMEGSTTLETIKVARQFVTFFNYPLNLETDYEDIDGTHSEEEMQAMIVHGRSSAHSIHLHFSPPKFLFCEQGKARLYTEASLTVDFKGSESFFEKRLLHFDWAKESGKWRISQVQIPQTHIE